MSHPRRPRLFLAIELAPTALLAAAVAAGLWGFSYDDGFITYRYAANQAEGRGLVFNPGETVLGTTAPGWALLLGALARSGAVVGLGTLGPGGTAVPGWGTLLTVAALWWLTAALPALWLPARSPLRPALPLVLGTLALTCRWNLELLGAEAFPAAALAATATWLALSGERDRDVAAGLVIAAAMLCRLDAALAAAAIGVALWVRRRRFPGRFAAAGLLPVAPYLVWLEAHFGTVLPNTLAGKRGEAALAPLGYGASQWEWLGRAFGEQGRWALVALAALGIVWLLWRVLAESRRGALTPLAVLGAWLLLHEAFYRAAGVAFAPWYHVAALDALLALAATGLAGVLSTMRRWMPETEPHWAFGIAVVLLTGLVLVLLPGVSWLAGTWGEPPDVRTRVYAAIGRHLERHSEPGAQVAAMEIGALAYASDRPVLDLVGLVDPAVLAAREAGRLAEHVAAAAPEHIVVPPPFLGRELGDVMAHPAIRSSYRPAVRFFDPDYEHDPVTLYRRLPDAPDAARR